VALDGPVDAEVLRGLQMGITQSMQGALTTAKPGS
jgi:hypothetical protein